MSTAIVVANITIVQDEHGRYNLNMLHRASEQAVNRKKEPAQWLRTKTAKSLLSALQNQDAYMHLDVVKGGDAPGTYAHELIAVSYAGWISPVFQLQVNQAFIDSRNTPEAPVVNDPMIQSHINALIEIDHVRTVAQEAREMALLAFNAQQWITVSQYVALHKLDRQLPVGTARQQYGKFVSAYCREHNWPMYVHTNVNGITENTYPAWAIQDTLPGWLARKQGQVSYLPTTTQEATS